MPIKKKFIIPRRKREVDPELNIQGLAPETIEAIKVIAGIEDIPVSLYLRNLIENSIKKEAVKRKEILTNKAALLDAAAKKMTVSFPNGIINLIIIKTKY